MSEENKENEEIVELDNEIKTENEGIKISNDVVAVIAGVAVSEVNGVAGMAGGFAGGISEVFSGKKNLAKGIKVEVSENIAKIDVNIIVEYGSRIPDVAFEIQNRVKKAVESMTGLKVEEVNVHVQGVGMDTGDMILKEEVDIGEDETTGELWERLSKIGGNLLVETLKEIEKGIAPREKQGNDYTLAPMLNKEMAKIDWENKTAEEIKNLVRGLNPIMGAYTFLNGKKIKFWKVSIATEDELITDNIEIMRNGTVIISDQKDGLFIKAKNGILKVLEIQGENAKKMSIGDFLRGNQIQEFDVFE